MEHPPFNQYFAQPCTIWFPDFETEIEQMEHRYRKYPVPFHAMLVLLSYFRREITRQAFLSDFFAQDAPQKLMPSDRRKHLQIKEFCIAYQNGQITEMELDERLLKCFRARPEDHAFSPPYAEWEHCVNLISRLKKKMKTLPHHFDGTAWNGYLSGRLTQKEYANAVLTWNLPEQITEPVYADKNEFSKKYAAEISVCIRLHNLCKAYADAHLTSDAFESQFLQLAEAFCADITE